MIGYNSQIVTDKIYLYTDPKNPLSFKPGDVSMYDMISNNVFISNSSIHLTYNSNGYFNHQANVNVAGQWRADLNQSFYNKDFTVQLLINSKYFGTAMTFSFDNRRLGPNLYYVNDYLCINTFDGKANKIPETYKIGLQKANKWELISVVFNKDANNILYYSNNEYIGQCLYRCPSTGNNIFNLGGNNDTGFIKPEFTYYAYDGLMGPCLIYNKCLSLKEIEQNCNCLYNRYASINI